MRPIRTGIAFSAIAVASIVLSGAVLFGYLSTGPAVPKLRLGLFPNLTHAQALYGVATEVYQRALQQAIGGNFVLEPQVFNAGPAAIQALLSHHVDATFVGPAPTLNGLTLAPNELRVLAGAASGGASFVVQPDLDLATDADFAGKTFATPQWGNTQDIALKHYLLTRGHRTLLENGDVEVVNAPNSFILTAFKLKQIHGAWVPEPWATRLIREAHAKVIVDERSLWPNGEFVSTQLVTTKTYLEGAGHREVLTAFLRAYVNVTLHLQNASGPDVKVILDEIYNLTASRLNTTTITAAFGNLKCTYDPISPSLRAYLNWSQDLGFLPRTVQTNSLYDLTLLNQVLVELGLPPVSAG